MRQQRREEGDRFLELDAELGRGMNPQAGQVLRFPPEQRLRTANDRKGFQVGLARQQQPFERVPHIPRGQPSAVMEPDVVTQEEAIALAAIFDAVAGRQAGDDLRQSSLFRGERLKDARQHFAELRGAPLLEIQRGDARASSAHG